MIQFHFRKLILSALILPTSLWAETDLSGAKHTGQEFTGAHLTPPEPLDENLVEPETLGAKPASDVSNYKLPVHELSRYKLTVQNLQVGEVVFGHDLSELGYKVTLDFKTKGLAGALFDTNLHATTTGKGNLFGLYAPQSAQIEMVNNGDKTAQNMVYANSNLKTLTTSPPLIGPPNPAQHPNAVDPLTALTYVLRPMPFEQLCELHIQVYDGLMSGYISLSKPTLRPDGRYQCKGGFQRDLASEPNPMQTVSDEVAPGTYYLNVLYRLDRVSGTYIVDRLVGKGSFGMFQMVQTLPNNPEPTPAAP